MRISTPGLFNTGIANILTQQSEMATAQDQVSSGQRFRTAGQDPSGMGRVLSLQNAQAEHGQLSSNVSTLRQRLGTEETALSSASDLLSRVRELAVQANNASVSADNRAQISQELQQRLSQLVDIANTNDGIGHYTFAGTQDGTPPFIQSGSGVSYAGTQQVRELSVGEGRTMSEGDAGDTAFLRIPNGNGLARVDSTAGNAGTLSVKGVGLAGGSVQSLTIRFSGGNYTVQDAGNNVLQSGAYKSGQAITVAGAQISLDGTPADGDSLTVKPAGNTDLFSRVQNVIDAVNAPVGTDAERAASQTRFFNALNELDAGISHISTVRASVGGRLSTLDDVDNRLQGIGVQLQQTLSDTRDLDYAESISRLQLHSTALQAAQAAFSKVQGLSLFNYLH